MFSEFVGGQFGIYRFTFIPDAILLDRVSTPCRQGSLHFRFTHFALPWKRRKAVDDVRILEESTCQTTEK